MSSKGSDVSGPYRRYSRWSSALTGRGTMLGATSATFAKRNHQRGAVRWGCFGTCPVVASVPGRGRIDPGSRPLLWPAVGGGRRGGVHPPADPVTFVLLALWAGIYQDAPGGDLAVQS